MNINLDDCWDVSLPDHLDDEGGPGMLRSRDCFTRFLICGHKTASTPAARAKSVTSANIGLCWSIPLLQSVQLVDVVALVAWRKQRAR